MADDYTESTKRAELLAALAVLAPQIRGLQDLSTTSISPNLKAVVTGQIVARTQRQTLIQAVLSGLDAVQSQLNTLANDGYPALPAVPVAGSLFDELHEENSDLDAAIAVFANEQIAAGSLTQTPNPNPPTAAGP